MRLSLFGWPPVASHVACLLVGMGFAHLGRSETPATPRLAARQILVALPAPRQPIPDGPGPMTAVRQAARGRCLVTAGPIYVIEKKPRLVLRAPLDAAGPLAALAGPLREGRVALQRASEAEHLPHCDDGEPRVTYGG